MTENAMFCPFMFRIEISLTFNSFVGVRILNIVPVCTKDRLLTIWEIALEITGVING